MIVKSHQRPEQQQSKDNESKPFHLLELIRIPTGASRSDIPLLVFLVNRLGPTDLWVVDSATTLVTRLTAPSKSHINSFGWLDDHRLIFDREENEDGQSLFPDPRSSLRQLSLQKAQD